MINNKFLNCALCGFQGTNVDEFVQHFRDHRDFWLFWYCGDRAIASDNNKEDTDKLNARPQTRRQKRY